MEHNFYLNSSDVEGDRLCNVSDVVTNTPLSTTSFLLYVFVGSLSVLIMCGNSLLITSIIYFKQLHTPTNYLILSLAVADLLVGVVVLPFSMILAVNSCWNVNDLLCKIRNTFDIFLSTASIFHLLCISVDRYYAVCQPLRYRTKINVCVIVKMILVSWVAPAIIANVASNTGEKKQGRTTKCFLYQNKSSNILAAVIVFYLPALIMFIIYLRILLVAQTQARSIQSTKCQSTKPGATVSKMERKATKTLAIVMGSFLLCWFPFMFSMSYNSVNDNSVPLPVTATFKWLGWSNSMFNPFVYAFFYSWFRSAFRMIMSGKIFLGNFSNSKLH